MLIPWLGYKRPWLLSYWYSASTAIWALRKQAAMWVRSRNTKLGQCGQQQARIRSIQGADYCHQLLSDLEMLPQGAPHSTAVGLELGLLYLVVLVETVTTQWDCHWGWRHCGSFGEDWDSPEKGHEPGPVVREPPGAGFPRCFSSQHALSASTDYRDPETLRSREIPPSSGRGCTAAPPA